MLIHVARHIVIHTLIYMCSCVVFRGANNARISITVNHVDSTTWTLTDLNSPTIDQTLIDQLWGVGEPSGVRFSYDEGCTLCETHLNVDFLCPCRA